MKPIEHWQKIRDAQSLARAAHSAGNNVTEWEAHQEILEHLDQLEQQRLKTRNGLAFEEGGVTIDEAVFDNTRKTIILATTVDRNTAVLGPFTEIRACMSCGALISTGRKCRYCLSVEAAAGKL